LIRRAGFRLWAEDLLRRGCFWRVILARAPKVFGERVKWKTK